MNTAGHNVITPVDTRKRQNLNIRTGDTVRVSVKVEEKGKTRLQVFEGIVLARKHGGEAGGTFTVRRSTGGVGVERIFPLYSPMIDKIEVIKRAKVRQANLYHIRDKAAKEVRRQMKNTKIVSETDIEQEGEEPVVNEREVNEPAVETEAEGPAEEGVESEQVEEKAAEQ